MILDRALYEITITTLRNRAYKNVPYEKQIEYAQKIISSIITKVIKSHSKDYATNENIVNLLRQEISNLEAQESLIRWQ